MKIMCPSFILVFLLVTPLPASEWKQFDEIVAIIGNEAICKSELNAYIMFFKPEYPLPPGERTPKYMSDALEELIQRTMTTRYFEKLFLPIIVPALLNEKKQVIEYRFPDNASFETALHKCGFTSMTLGKWIKEDYILLWGVNRQYGVQEISPLEIQQYINNRQNDQDAVWMNWLSPLSDEDREKMVRNILMSGKIREKLSEIADTVKKQLSVTVLYPITSQD